MLKRKSQSGLVTALDIGSSKVACFVAKLEGGSPRVVGIGHQVSRGVRGGNIVDMNAAQEAVIAAVTAAERMAGEALGEVVVTVSCGQPQSRSVEVEVAIAGHEIGDGDIRRVCDQGRAAEQSPDRKLLHAIPVRYSIDGSVGVRDPRGMCGQRLGGVMHVVSAQAGALRNLETVINRCHMAVSGFIVSPYAAGLATLVDDEMDLGVTLIDMGGGATGVAVFVEGQLLHTDQLAIGGNHVTNDIARGLSTPVAHAERLKTLHGHCLPSAADDKDQIDVPLVGEEESSQANHVPKSILTRIIRPRLEETFEMVRARLEAVGMDRVAGRRVVLTGGAAQLQGVRELAATVLDRQVRIGKPLKLAGLSDQTGGPQFAACAGLVSFALNRHAEASLPVGQAPRAKERFGMFRWLKENFLA